MAVANLNKPYVYDLLGRLNALFGRVIRNLAELKNTGAFNPKTVKTISGLSRELQANANVHLLEDLRDAEQKDWARLGKIRKTRSSRKMRQ